ncbi:MAG: hypothetical protein ACKVQS_12795 [Fimbriimonadaceae bacterium]
MKLLQQQLKRFGRRVRLVRMWRGAWIGLLGGAALAVALVAADYLLLINFPPMAGLILAGASLVGGGLIGFFLRVSELSVAQSVDRRAGLEDRTASAWHKAESGEFFASELGVDAEKHLGEVQPRRLYPIRFGAQQMSACAALAVLVTAVYVVDNDLLLTPGQKEAKAELKEATAQVERVVRELEVGEGAADKAAEKKLASELRKFGKELERGRLDREEAMQKAQKLAEDAKKLSEQRLEKAQTQMEQFQAKGMQEKFEEAGGDLEMLKDLQLDKMQMEALDELMRESGADKMPSNQLDQNMMKALGADNSASEMARLSDAQKQKLAEQMAEAQKDIQKKLEQGNLSEAERKALEQQSKTMEELAKKLEMSEDVKKALKELQEMKEYKEMQKLMEQMKQAQQQMQEGKPMTDEQIREMQKQMEQLAEQMKDPAAKEAMRQAMKEVIEQMKQGKIDAKTMQQMMSMMGMGPDGSGGKEGGAYQGEGENEKGDPLTLEGKGKITAIRGERDEKRGQDAYTEIKAPTMVGSRTSVPYDKVLPGYKKTAESAVSNNKVKGKNRERVREYFEQLSGGGKGK